MVIGLLLATLGFFCRPPPGQEVTWGSAHVAWVPKGGDQYAPDAVAVALRDAPPVEESFAKVRRIGTLREEDTVGDRCERVAGGVQVDGPFVKAQRVQRPRKIVSQRGKAGENVTMVGGVSDAYADTTTLEGGYLLLAGVEALITSALSWTVGAKDTNVSWAGAGSSGDAPVVPLQTTDFWVTNTSYLADVDYTANSVCDTDYQPSHQSPLHTCDLDISGGNMSFRNINSSNLWPKGPAPTMSFPNVNYYEGATLNESSVAHMEEQPALADSVQPLNHGKSVPHIEGQSFDRVESLDQGVAAPIDTLSINSTSVFEAEKMRRIEAIKTLLAVKKRAAAVLDLVNRQLSQHEVRRPWPSSGCCIKLPSDRAPRRMTGGADPADGEGDSRGGASQGSSAESALRGRRGRRPWRASTADRVGQPDFDVPAPGLGPLPLRRACAQGEPPKFLLEALHGGWLCSSHRLK
jgi:hypothetical protein